MAETLDTTMGTRIREARRAAGYRNAESFAVALGVGQRTVQRWETGRFTPSIARLIEIAKLTGKPVSHFITTDEAAA